MKEVFKCHAASMRQPQSLLFHPLGMSIKPQSIPPTQLVRGNLP